MKIIVNEQKCPKNHRCPSIDVCPNEAIVQSDIHSLPTINSAKCILCGACIDFCPMGAFEKVER